MSVPVKLVIESLIGAGAGVSRLRITLASFDLKVKETEQTWRRRLLRGGAEEKRSKSREGSRGERSPSRYVAPKDPRWRREAESTRRFQGSAGRWRRLY